MEKCPDGDHRSVLSPPPSITSNAPYSDSFFHFPFPLIVITKLTLDALCVVFTIGWTISLSIVSWSNRAFCRLQGTFTIMVI